MSPPSRLLPEVSGFTISFIGGSAGSRARRAWNLNGWLHTTRLLQVEQGYFNPREWKEKGVNALCCQT